MKKISGMNETAFEPRFPKLTKLLLLAMIVACCFFAGCGSSPKHQSPQEQALGYYWYEAVILNKEDVEAAFAAASGHYPSYEYVPDVFHVTTQYKPETKHESLYGKAVTVHIIGYTAGAVQTPEEGLLSKNEGFLVEVSSADEDMQSLLDSYDRVWHITGSYTDAAHYTGKLDFSNATPIDVTIEGVFGMADSAGKVILE